MCICVTTLHDRIQRSTFQVGAMIAAGVAIAFGVEAAAYYVVGIFASVSYLFLLGAEVDSIGAGKPLSRL